MSKILLALLFSLTASMSYAANHVNFYWTPPTTNADGTVLTDLAGHKIYCGRTTKIYTFTVNVPGPTVTTYPIKNIPAITNGTWFCALTAYDLTANESVYSNEISFFLDGTAPKGPTGFGVQ